MVEIPSPSIPAESKIVQAVAARARGLDPGQDPLEIGARPAYGPSPARGCCCTETRLTGGAHARTAVIIQPANGATVAPLVTLTYGLSERESEVTRLCMGGAFHEADGARPRLVAAHCPGSSQVDLRQDRRPNPQRAGQPNLPRALRAPLGRHPRRSCPRPSPDAAILA